MKELKSGIDYAYDVVNDNDKIIGKASYKELYSKNLLHRIVHIFLFNRRGELFPSYWGASASGMVPIGKNYLSAAKMELKEELGTKTKLTFLFKVRVRKPQNRFIAVFKAYYNGKFKLDPDEVAGGRFFRIGEIKRIMKNKNAKITPGFKATFREYLKRFNKS